MATFSFGAAIVITISSACTWVLAQAPTSPNDVRRQQLELERRLENDMEQRMRNLRTLDERLRRMPPKPPQVRELTEEEKEHIRRARRIEASTLDRYSSFLREPKAGIFKLFPDLDCQTRNVVRVDGECGSVAEHSSAFTFRAKSYGTSDFHDIWFSRDRIVTKNFFSQGIIASIGDVPIEQVDTAHPAFRFISDFQSATDPRIAAEHVRQFQEGVESGGYKYTDGFEPKVGETYVMRHIAYRLGNAFPRFNHNSSKTDMMFYSLTADIRVDSLFVFKIVGRDEAGGLTFVWKELSRRDAPKIKFSKGDRLADFRLARAESK